MHRPGRPNSAPPMVGILESATALFRTPEGSPVGPAIRRLRASIAILAGIVGLGVIGYWLIALPVGYLLCFRYGYGALGLWIGFCAGLIICGVALVRKWAIASRIP